MAVRPIVPAATPDMDVSREDPQRVAVNRGLIALAIIIVILSVGLLYVPYVVGFLLD